MNTSYVPAGWEVNCQVYVAPSRAHKLFAPYGVVPPDTAQVPFEEVPPPPLSMMMSAKALPAQKLVKRTRKNRKYLLGQRLLFFMKIHPRPQSAQK